MNVVQYIKAREKSLLPLKPSLEDIINDISKYFLIKGEYLEGKEFTISTDWIANALLEHRKGAGSVCCFTIDTVQITTNFFSTSSVKYKDGHVHSIDGFDFSELFLMPMTDKNTFISRVGNHKEIFFSAYWDKYLIVQELDIPNATKRHGQEAPQKISGTPVTLEKKESMDMLSRLLHRFHTGALELAEDLASETCSILIRRE